MKVTAKKPCVSSVFEVVEEGKRFYIVYGDTIGSYKALPKDGYEPVREWKDMTGVYGGITVNVPGLEDREFKLEIATNGYRLFERRKQ